MTWTFWSKEHQRWEWVTFLVAKVWTYGICNHYVIDGRDGAVLVATRERRERESWLAAKEQLAARGYLGQDYVTK